MVKIDMARDSLRDQLEAWKAKRAGTELAPEKSYDRQEKNKRERRKDRVSKQEAPKFNERIKSDIRRSWANGYTHEAVLRLIDLAKAGGTFSVDPISTEISSAIRNLGDRGSIDLDEQVLAYSALKDRTSILSIASDLVTSFSNENNLEFDEVRISSTENFKRFLSSVLHHQQAQKVIFSHRQEAVSLAEERVACERVRLFIKRAEGLYPHQAVDLPSPIPTADDIRLAAAWSNDPSLQNENVSAWVLSGVDSVPDNYQKDWELGRCLSARLAEKVAEQIYKNMGCEVRDVASLQLSQNGDDSWKLFDLQVDGRKIDVKNARRSFSSPEIYSEHCVPRFKLDRNLNEVTIAGVLSDYLWVDHLVHREKANDPLPVIFLGETTLRMIEKLSTHFCKTDYLELDFSRSGRGEQYFLPAWTFSYPNELYASAKKAAEDLRKTPLPPLKDFKKAKVSIVAPLLVSKHPDTDKLLVDLDTALSRIAGEILVLLEKFGRDLAALFLWVLLDFLKISRSLSNCKNFDPQIYKEVLYFKKNRTYPGGVYDPLETVNALIDCLDTLWRENRESIAGYSQFRIRGGTILQGRSSRTEGRWETLIAHCGGWRLNGPKCGKYPLVAGRNKLCKECGHLICDEQECDFCSQYCPRYLNRQPQIPDVPEI